MKNKAPLALMEQLIMLLVFAIAAAVCLRGFAWADSTSKHNQNRDLALVQAQSAAAVIQQTRGDLAAAAERMGGRAEQDKWVVHYDEAWERTEETGAFILQVTPVSASRPLLGAAEVTVTDGGEPLAALNVCWQEVTGDAG